MDSWTTENGHGTKESVGEVKCQGLEHANSALVLIAIGASSSSLHALRALPLGTLQAPHATVLWSSRRAAASPAHGR